MTEETPPSADPSAEPPVRPPTHSPTHSEEQPAAVADALELLRAQLLDAQAQAASARDAQLRAIAELDNVRKRAEREISTSARYGADRVLGDLLAICDSLDLGLKAAAVPEATVKALVDGLKLTQQQLAAFLEKHGVKVLDPAGQPFDPQVHEAVAAIESPDVPPNHVLSVMQKGYRLHERLLRPAMVVVAKAPAAAQAEPQNP